MSKISQCRALLLAAVVPAVLVAGCAAGGGTQAMKGAASPATPTDTVMPPEETTPPEETDTASPTATDTGMETATPTDTAGMAGQARSVVQGYFDALKSGNVDQVAGAFADDAWVAMAGTPTAQGTDAIRTLYQDKLRDDGMKRATYTIEDVLPLGSENALVRATSRRGEADFRELFVLMQDGGEWKISQYMSNRMS
ncbi:YybH family protein [Nonomuraea sp. NPDC049480]|uniref:YybH family protein n=1 Tax=Nonomuraea sp. NPDC049480 TaxID=3364353 RepID=UPI0037A850AA